MKIYTHNIDAPFRMKMLCTSNKQLKLGLLLLIYLSKLATRTQQHCYELRLTSIRTSETPDYRFELFLHSNNTLSSITRVLKDVPTPIWHIVLARYNDNASSNSKVNINGNDSTNISNKKHGNKTLTRRRNGPTLHGIAFDEPTVLYNTSHKVCDFTRYLQRVRAFASITTFLSKTSNMSLTCPLKSNTYVMRNIRVPPDAAIMQLAYAPKTHFMLTGTVYSQLADKSLLKLCHYDINGTVTKKC